MHGIMDALSPSHPARRVIFMKAKQVGATEGGNNWIGCQSAFTVSAALTPLPFERLICESLHGLTDVLSSIPSLGRKRCADHTGWA